MVRKKATSDRAAKLTPRLIKPRAAHTVDEKTSAVSAAMPKSRPPLRLAPSNADAGRSSQRRSEGESRQSASSASVERAILSSRPIYEEHKPVLSFSSRGPGGRGGQGLRAVVPVAKQHTLTEGTRRSARMKPTRRRGSNLQKVAPAVSKAVPPSKGPPLPPPLELRSAPLKLKRAAPPEERPAKRHRPSDEKQNRDTQCGGANYGFTTRISERIQTFQKKATLVLEQRKPLYLRARSPEDARHGTPCVVHAHASALRARVPPAAAAAVPPVTDWRRRSRRLHGAARRTGAKNETLAAGASQGADSVAVASTRGRGELRASRHLGVVSRGTVAHTHTGLSARTARMSMVPRRARGSSTWSAGIRVPTRRGPPETRRK
eukprot:GEMP01035452.1.p1 GENE.GEMP01035452.1~~GEMP01035452.1.p1  ORF type:complete len:377 (+),score=122.39 GEMP01035452.1:94-1224(+)